jgi:hypothetical protein
MIDLHGHRIASVRLDVRQRSREDPIPRRQIQVDGSEQIGGSGDRRHRSF